MRRLCLILLKYIRRILAMRPKGKRISSAVRRAIEASSLSRYAICKAAGIDQAAMSRFMAGKSGLTTASLDALADVLGLEIVIRRKRRKGR